MITRDQYATIMTHLHPAFEAGPFDLKVLLAQDPPIDWRPKEPGTSVLGVVLRIIDGSSRYVASFPIIELMTVEGTVVRIRCSSVVLRNQVDDLNPRPGQVIEFTYNGKKDSRAGFTYGLYKVKVA